MTTWPTAYNRAPALGRVALLAFPQGRRLYVRGLRIHHGLTGAVLAVIGLALALHDRRDWPWPLNDRRGT